MNKEIIEKFDKEQLDILLNDLQDIDKFTGFEDGAFKYELGKYQANLLINCIKKQKEINQKAIEYIKERFYFNEETGEYSLLHTFDKCNAKELLDILNEVSE